MVGVDPALIRRIGFNISKARERAGMTIDQVASAIGISPRLLSEVEDGGQDACADLDLLTFLRIARCTGSAAVSIFLEE